MDLGTNLYFKLINTQMELFKWFLNSSILITKGNIVSDVLSEEEKRVAKENKKLYRGIVKQCLKDGRVLFNGHTIYEADKAMITLLVTAIKVMRERLLDSVQNEMETFSREWAEKGPDVINSFIQYDPTTLPDMSTYGSNVRLANSFFLYPHKGSELRVGATFVPGVFYEDIPLNLINEFDLYITGMIGGDFATANRVAIFIPDEIKYQLFALGHSEYVVFHKRIHTGVMTAFKAKGLTPIVDRRSIQ